MLMPRTGTGRPRATANVWASARVLKSVAAAQVEAPLLCHLSGPPWKVMV